MSKFCGKCGSKLDEKTGLCPNCDLIQSNQNSGKADNQKHGKKLVLKIIVIIAALIAAVAAFFALDYFDIIPTDVSKLIGLKSSGSFEIESDKDYVFTSENEEYSVAFYCKPDVEFSSIELYCENSNSNTASFSDDGNLEENNDLKAEDGVYSAQIGVKETEVKTLKYHAVMKDGLRYYISNTVEVEVKSDWTEDELSVMEKADNAIQELISKEDYKNKTFDQKSDSVNKLLNELSEDENGALIIADSICFDEESGIYSFEYSNGCLGCVSIEKNIEDSGVIFGDSSSSSSTNQGSSDTNENSSQPAVNSSNTDAVIMYDWYEDKDSVLEFYREYQEEWNEKGLDTELSINPTVEQYATQLSDNALILIAAHGSRYTLKSGLFKPSATYSVICTHEHCTNDIDKNYKFDINQKNIVRANTEDGKYYWMLPAFFSTHYSEGGLNDSIVLINSCCGFGEEDDIDYDLAGNMTGASAVVGFHNSVEIFNIYKLTQKEYVTKSFGTLFIENVVDSLLKSETVDTAFNKAKKTIGDTQFVYHQNYGYDNNEEDKSVYPLISGNANSKLSVSGNTSEYKTGDYLLKVGDKYICSDGNAIYYKNSIVENGRKIADMKNTGQLLSDGQTVFFVASTSEVATEFISCKMYSVQVDGSNLKELFTSTGAVEILAGYNDTIYYYDAVDYGKGTIKKYNLTNKISNDFYDANLQKYDGCYFNFRSNNNKLYIVGRDYQNRNRDCFISIDLARGTSSIVDEQKSILFNRSSKDKFSVFCGTYDDDKNKYNNCYIYYLDTNNNLQKSAELPSKLDDLQIVSDDGTFALFFSSFNETDFDLYKYDINTGNVDIVSNGAGRFKGKGYGVTCDLKKPEDIYFISGYIYKFNGNNFDSLVCEYFPSYERYWIVDGIFVNDKFECYELTLK